MAEKVIRLNDPHPGQIRLLDEAKRFNVVNCGRRWGKSALAENLLAEPALEGKPVGYFTPTYKLLDGTFNELVASLEPIISRKHDHQFIQLKTGGRIEFWSLENELAGRSRKYARTIIDEAAFVKSLWKSWTESIRATLTDLKGDAWFLSTPRGKNDFYKLHSRGTSGEPNWMSWTMPTVSNPYIDPSEIEDARKDLPELAFLQEYEAKFNDNVANPFGSDHIARCVIQALSPNPPVAIGVDLAKKMDWTVILGLDQFGDVCLFQRFQRDWRATLQAILGLPAGVPLILDSTGVGDPIGEEVARSREVELFQFTSPAKQKLMEGLALSIQKRELGFPLGMIKDELDSFEYEFTRTGVKYSAPQFMHDDCVMALGMARDLWNRVGRFSGQYSIH